MQTESELKEQVEAGAKWADDAAPGWHNVASAKRLAMDVTSFHRVADGCFGCVGAQLSAAIEGAEGAGSFAKFRREYRLSLDSSKELGFFPDDDAERDDDDDLVAWNDGTVDRLWTAEIMSRREADDEDSRTKL